MNQKNSKTMLLMMTAMLMITSAAVAQFKFPDKEKCVTLKGRTLAVKLFSEDKQGIKQYNDAIRKAYTEEWKMTPVEFVNREKYDELVKEGNTKYAVVFPTDVVNTLTHEYSNSATTLFDRSWTFEHYDIYLSLVTGPGKLDNITSISFTNGDLMPSEFYFAALQLAMLTTSALNDVTGKAYYDAERNIEYIKSKTFLLPAEMFKEKDIPKIGDKYEYPYKMSNFKDLNEAVLSKNADYVYPKIIWSNQHRAYGWITVSAADGSVRSFMSFSGLATGSNEKANELLKPGQLNDALSKMMQKVNNKYD